MDISLPTYDLDHRKPIIAHGNFTPTYSPSLTCHLDSSIVNQKFELWKHVLQHNLLTSSDSLQKAKAWLLLKDKAIFAYNYFKLDMKPFKARAVQDVILSDPHDRILFCGCNQFLGKSTTLDIDAATEFLLDHQKGWVGILVSNSLDQSKERMSRIKLLLRTMDIQYREEETVETKTGKRDNATQISFTFYGKDGKPLYTNLLICCPHTSSALGYPANNLWMDEFDFWDDCDYERFIYQIAIPRTFYTKGKIKVYTNPDGKGKMLFKLWNQKGRDGNPAWHRYHFNYWDSDNASQEGFEKASQGMTRARVESTLLALFTDATGAYFTEDEIRKSFDINVAFKPDSQVFMFLDVGAKHDQSVLVMGYIDYPDGEEGFPHIYVPKIHCYPVGYPLSRVVGAFSEGQDTDGWHYEKSVKDYYNEFMADNQVPILGVDTTGNSGIIPLCETAGLFPTDVVFSGQAKSGYYQRFKYFMEKGLIHRCKSDEFDYQCSHLEMQKSSRGYLMIHHEKEDDLDDVPDSIAGLIALCDPQSNKFASPSIKVF